MNIELIWQNRFYTQPVNWVPPKNVLIACCACDWKKTLVQRIEDFKPQETNLSTVLVSGEPPSTKKMSLKEFGTFCY